MKKHLFLTALVLALVMCFSCGALAADSGYINNYDISDFEDGAIVEGNVTFMTVGQWRAAEGISDKTVTFFDGGEALSDDDIIIMNNEAAIVLAVGTRNPWGYPNGSVLDAGVVKDGAGYRDTTWSIEFLANWWDSWGPANCGTVMFEIVKYDFDKKVETEDGVTALRVTRGYDLAGIYGAEGQNNDKNMTIVTYYGAPQEGSYLYMFDTMANNMDEDIWYNNWSGLGNGYEDVALSVTNKGDDGAATFGSGMAYRAVGSYANTNLKPGSDDFAGEYLTSLVILEDKFVSEQGEEYIMPGTGGKSGYQELYIQNANMETYDSVSGNQLYFKANDSVKFGAYIVCSDKADHAVLNDFIFAQKEIDTYPVAINGIEGQEGDMEVILTNGDGKLGWYTVDAAEGGILYLPAGEYSMVIEKNGYIASDKITFTVAPFDYTGKVTSFTDVEEGAWYYDAVAFIEDKGIINGYAVGDGTYVFRPENDITRAEFAVMAYRFLGSPEATTESAFVDVDRADYDWAIDAIDYLAEEEIINGVGDNKFAPAEKIKRGDICVLLNRMFKVTPENASPFSDVTGDYYYNKDILAMAEAGIVEGFPEGDFRPEAPATRAQVATIFTRLFGLAPVADVDAALGAKLVPVTVNVEDQDGNAVFARIGTYKGETAAYANTLYPTVRYIGESVYYTDGKPGEVEVLIPENTACALRVFGEGYFFTSAPVDYAIAAADAVAGAEFDVTVTEAIEVQDNYYGGDVHHHTNKNDAFALPADVVNSYLASGLDVVTNSDHDYTTNNFTSYEYIQSISETAPILGYMPSMEISASWAHFNVVPTTEKGWNYYLNADADNAPARDADGITLAFTDLPYFLEEVNAQGASLTANHPWYSYGLFTALGKDAVPGGYDDGYDMIGLNSSYRDQEMSKTICSGFDLWDGYADYLNGGDGIVDIVGGGVEGQLVEVTRPHYYAGGSDTHDVLTAQATNLGLTSNKIREDREEFFTGKVRSYAFIEEASDGENYLMDNALAFGNAMVNGNSYTTNGPILDLSKVPGTQNTRTGAYSVRDELKYEFWRPVVVPATFELDVTVESLEDLNAIYVISSDGTETVVDHAKGDLVGDYKHNRAFTLNHVYQTIDLSEEATNTYTLNLEYQPTEKGEYSWVAICAVDKYGCFAITNAYWVYYARY